MFSTVWKDLPKMLWIPLRSFTPDLMLPIATLFWSSVLYNSLFIALLPSAGPWPGVALLIFSGTSRFLGRSWEGGKPCTYHVLSMMCSKSIQRGCDIQCRFEPAVGWKWYRRCHLRMFGLRHLKAQAKGSQSSNGNLSTQMLHARTYPSISPGA